MGTRVSPIYRFSLSPVFIDRLSTALVWVLSGGSESRFFARRCDNDNWPNTQYRLPSYGVGTYLSMEPPPRVRSSSGFPRSDTLSFFPHANTVGGHCETGFSYIAL